MAPTINVLLSSFPGLGLPSTLCIPLCSELPVNAFTTILSERLPAHAEGLLLTSRSGRRIDADSCAPLATLLPDSRARNLELCLTSRLLGGKGGFGSQLRAAGGRMSSRKNRNGRDPNASSRNLDGRRLRTVNEAKALAEYLATKPDMDKKVREERRKRWEAVVDAAEKREDEIKNGKKGVRLDGEWVERKEEEETKTREAVLAMLKAESMNVTGSETDNDAEGDSDDGENVEASKSGSGSSENEEDAGARSFFGWDEDDMSEDDLEEDEADEQTGSDLVKSAVTDTQYEGQEKSSLIG